VSEKTLLDTAMRIGEESAEKAIRLELKMRRIKWKVYRARHLLKTGRASQAEALLADLLQQEFTAPR
jgi:hypothetical protein